MSKQGRVGRSDRGPRYRRVVTAGEALQAVLEETGASHALVRYRALTYWPSAVGPQIAAVTNPQRLDKGTLIVAVTSAPWRAELTMQRREIMQKLNAILGDSVVHDIRFR